MATQLWWEGLGSSVGPEVRSCLHLQAFSKDIRPFRELDPVLGTEDAAPVGKTSEIPFLMYGCRRWGRMMAGGSQTRTQNHKENTMLDGNEG